MERPRAKNRLKGLAWGLSCLLASAFIATSLAALAPSPSPIFGVNSAEGQTLNNLEVIWQRRGIDTVDLFGRSLAGGDVNGDGKSDLVIGAPPRSIAWYKGVVYIFTDVNDTIADIVLNGENKTDQYGQIVCTGDFNHDGYCDVAVSAPSYGATYEDGKVYVYYGGNPMDTIADWAVTRTGSRENFGWSLTAGDINGDGKDDLIVGAPQHASINWGDGCAYIYYGDTLGLHTWPDIVLHGGLSSGGGRGVWDKSAELDGSEPRRV